MRPSPATQTGFLDVALEAYELLTEEGIVQQEVGFGAGKIKGKADGEARSRQASPAEVELFEPNERGGEELEEEREKHEK